MAVYAIKKLSKRVLWEIIPGGHDGDPGSLMVSRTKVPGGWLVYVYDHSETDLRGWAHGGLTFYPDPEHEWSGSSIP